MFDKLKKHPEVFNALWFVLGAIILVVSSDILLPIIAPFAIAYIVAKILRPITLKVSKKTKIPYKAASLVALILFSTLVGIMIWLVSSYVVDGVTYLINALSSADTINKIIEFSNDVWIKLEETLQWMNIEFDLNEMSSMITDMAKKALTVLSDISVNIAMKVPSALLGLLIGWIAAFYMLADYDRLARFALKQMTVKTKQVVDVLNNQVLLSMLKMIGAYILISCICFVEMVIGLSILRVENVLFVSLIIAIVDVLPILGSGGILVPWGLISILLGSPLVGIGLIVLWIVIVVVRQIVEPKIVGSQIGLHPLATIMSIYIGLQSMGGLGLLFGPLYIMICKKLNEEKVFNIYKNRNE